MKIQAAWMILIAIVLTFGGAPIQAHADAYGTDILRVAGSGSLAPVIDDCAKRFNEQNPDKTVVVIGGHTGDGFRKFFDGNAEVVMASRDITDKERKQAESMGVEFTRKVAGRGAVVFIAHRNVSVNQLTLADIRGILTGAITNWSQVGGRDEAIKGFVVDDPASGTRAFIQEELLGGKDFGNALSGSKAFTQIPVRVSQAPGGFGFCRLKDLERSKKQEEADSVKIIAVSTGLESPAVLPTKQDVGESPYPVARPYYLFYDPAKGPLIETFVEFCLPR